MNDGELAARSVRDENVQTGLGGDKLAAGSVAHDKLTGYGTVSADPTRVAGLNADLLDGLDGTGFVRNGTSAQTGGFHVTGAGTIDGLLTVGSIATPSTAMVMNLNAEKVGGMTAVDITSLVDKKLCETYLKGVWSGGTCTNQHIKRSDAAYTYDQLQSTCTTGFGEQVCGTGYHLCGLAEAMTLMHVYGNGALKWPQEWVWTMGGHNNCADGSTFPTYTRATWMSSWNGGYATNPAECATGSRPAILPVVSSGYYHVPHCMGVGSSARAACCKHF